jgi:hypothetical protein
MARVLYGNLPSASFTSSSCFLGEFELHPSIYKQFSLQCYGHQATHPHLGIQLQRSGVDDHRAVSTKPKYKSDKGPTLKIMKMNQILPPTAIVTVRAELLPITSNHPITSMSGVSTDPVLGIQNTRRQLAFRDLVANVIVRPRVQLFLQVIL